MADNVNSESRVLRKYMYDVTRSLSAYVERDLGRIPYRTHSVNPAAFIRGLPYMTSAKVWDFLTLLPFCPNFMYGLSAELGYFLTPPPP